MKFEIKGKDFYKDGKPIKLISGAVHYFRNLPETWDDIFAKLRACGCNCVETYCAWNQHEKAQGKFDFSGILDIVTFLKKAQEHGLMAIVRPGPYICAEFEFGGLPWWLLNDPDLIIRCGNEKYIKRFDAYLDELLSRIRPLLCTNGGPVIMMQVENEYGYYGDDKTYLRHVRDGYRARGIDVPLFTSDGCSKTDILDGNVDGCLATLNFGSRVEENFAAHDELFPESPKMCMEMWNGWFDAWGDEKHHTRGAEEYAKTLDDMLTRGSANMYMFIGGTNFGFTAGANHYDTGGENSVVKFAPDVTSYDYDAPLTEWGDTTPKYYAIREIIQKHVCENLPEVPPNRPKKAYGEVSAIKSANLFENLENLSSPIVTDVPKPMESYGIGSGYILYTTTLERDYNNTLLEFERIGDRALVYVNDDLIGKVYVNDKKWSLTFSASAGDTLKILCENVARTNFGARMMYKKGVVGNLLLDNRIHFGWQGYPLPMDNLQNLTWKQEISEGAGQFYQFELNVEGNPCDTFLRTDNFTKGFVVINGFNLGRYWEIGPQKTLYVPAGILKEGKNEIVLFDGDGKKGEPKILFTDTPDLG